MRFTDREKVADITMRLWDGTSWGQDISGEMLSEPDMQFSRAHDAWLVDNVDFVDVKDVIEDYDQVAASLYDGGWRAADRDDIKNEYDLTDEQTDKICEKLAEYEK